MSGVIFNLDIFNLKWQITQGVRKQAPKGRLKKNKTKYFRLRLTDKVSSERPKRDLRDTWG